MKRIFIINKVLFAVALFALSACTHNNGDIGEYFGEWKLESITVDSEPDANYKGDIFWAFQASVFNMQQVSEDYSYSQSWGTWEEDGNILRLNFTHSDNLHPQGSSYYSPLPDTRLPKGITDLEIYKMTGSRMELGFVDSEGQTIRYKLKKWY